MPKTTSAEVRTIANRALDALKREFGDDVPTIAKMVYGETCEVRFTFALGGAEQRESDERAKWEQLAPVLHHGLRAEHFGQQFEMGGKWYRIAGVAPTRSKKSIKITRVHDGAKFVSSPESVAAHLALTVATRS